MEVRKVTYLGNGIYAHVCPLCGGILASSSEADMMPEFSICNCDAERAAYDIIDRNGVRVIRRNIAPRFVGVVNDGGIDSVEWVDQCSALEAARAVNEAAEWLLGHNG